MSIDIYVVHSKMVKPKKASPAAAGGGGKKANPFEKQFARSKHTVLEKRTAQKKKKNVLKFRNSFFSADFSLD
jgi:hypothetical protein